MTSLQISSSDVDGAKGLKPISIDSKDLAGVCEVHGRWSRSVPAILAKQMDGRCPECEAIARREEERAEAERRQRAAQGKRQHMIAKLFGQSEIPKRFQKRTFENYTATNDEQEKALAKARAYATNFPRAMELGASFVFCGKPGTGKTHLACAIANHVMATFGASALFTTVFDAISRVKATYGDSGTSEREVMRSLVQPDLLILDEVGVQFGTEYEKVIITDIINRRYSDMRPTIILSNLDQAELEDYLGARVIDRMFEGGGGVLAFTWDSYRPKVARDKALPAGEYRAPEWMQGA